jgi:hypothetical protein
MKKLFWIFVFIIPVVLAFQGCFEKDDEGGTVEEFSDVTVDVAKSLEDFVVKTQAYETAVFTNMTASETRAIVDDYINAGEKLVDDLNALIDMQHDGSSAMMMKSTNDLPCGPVDLVPDLGNGMSPGLAKSVASLIEETKGEVKKIQEKYDNGEIDETLYNEAMNQLKLMKTTKAYNLGIGAILGTGASIGTGLIIGTATAPAVAVVTAVGVTVGTGYYLISNWWYGIHKNGLEEEKYLVTAVKGKIGDPLPSTMFENYSNMIIAIDGYAPISLAQFELPEKGHQKTIEIKPVKAEDVDEYGTTEVCYYDELLTATSCEEVAFVTGTPYPQDPGPGVGVTVTASLMPSVEGCNISFSIVGTDGYSNSATYPSDANGQASFYIPGGAEGVVDHVTITTENGKQFTVTYVF